MNLVLPLTVLLASSDLSFGQLSNAGQFARRYRKTDVVDATTTTTQGQAQAAAVDKPKDEAAVFGRDRRQRMAAVGGGHHHQRKLEKAMSMDPTPDPTPQPTPDPTPDPTPEPITPESTPEPTPNPTRRPTRKPTRRPTRKPTRKPVSMRDVQRSACGVTGSSRTRVSRNFEFDLVNDDRGQCVDDDDNAYSFGAFEDVRKYTDCAKRCVEDVDRRLRDSDGFRGIEFDCSHGICKCLYDPDVDISSRVFDNTGSDDGEGPIDDTAHSHSIVYCGALVDNLQAESKAAIA